MHPLDSSLDASVHGHGSARRARRRTSLDNSSCLTTTELMMFLHRSTSSEFDDDLNRHTQQNKNNAYSCMYNYNSDLSSSFHKRGNGGGYSSNTRTGRRLSLSNRTNVTATFLAVKNNSFKTDLDADCHSWVAESPHNKVGTVFTPSTTAPSSMSSSTHSTFQRQHVLDVSHNAQSTTSRNAIVSASDKENDPNLELDNDDDDISSCGSFCEASCAEQANHEYMRQEFGASCFWDGDDDFFSHVDQDAVSVTEKELEILHANDLDYEANCCFEASGDGMITMANGPAGSPLLVQQQPYRDATATINSYDGYAGSNKDDDSASSDCDSFCEANEQEPANKVYLKTDLGASCFWASRDELLLDDDDDDDVAHGDDLKPLRHHHRAVSSTAAAVGIGTITEEG
jgi:hypothetical protein